MIQKYLPQLKDVLQPKYVPVAKGRQVGITQGGSSGSSSGSRPAASNGLHQPFKPFVITPVTLPGLPKSS